VYKYIYNDCFLRLLLHLYMHIYLCVCVCMREREGVGGREDDVYTDMYMGCFLLQVLDQHHVIRV